MRKGYSGRSKRRFGVSLAISIWLWTTEAQTLVDKGSPCATDQDCSQRYNSTVSTCQVDTGTCSNPFQMGCLHARLGKKKRVCNSDDEKNSDLCLPPTFNYSEIRIHNGNWESSVFLAWINQIVLMELADVPATVGLTTNETSIASFYSPLSLGKDLSSVFSPEMYPWHALRLGDQVLRGEEKMNSCSETDLPCVQFLPEAWIGGAKEYQKLLEQEIVEPRSENGLLGVAGLHIPIVLAEQHPELSIWFGWKGEEKRQFLAETFRRPLNWSDYCDQISPSQCQEPDETASRPPDSIQEGERYFIPGNYNGYFHATSKNNCTANPTTCTGAFIGPPCEWANYVEGQLYHNDIVGLEMDGPLQPNGGYPGPRMKEIWFAANATKSPIIMYWYMPDTLPIQFIGSDYEFQVVAFPSPSFECEANRPSTNDRCSDDIQERRGNAKGACMDRIQPLSFIITQSIGESTFDAEEADQSPAYETLKSFELTNLDVAVILQEWQIGNDPREALCDWVVHNLERLQEFVPTGYPRKEEIRSEYSSPVLILSQVLGGFALFVTLVALALCFKYRDTKTMVFTQPIFMMLILFGMTLICGGAIFYAIKPSKAICTTAAWLIVQGYTIELVAVLVKTAAINQLVHSSKKMKRVNIRRNVMLMKVLGVNLVVSACMIIWTVLDQPTGKESQDVSINDDGSVTVVTDLKCASTYIGWRMAAIAWQVLLLILAGVLAYQSRHVMEQLNESKSLAMMVYSHFLFVCLRGVTSYFYMYDTLPSSITSALFSLNFSMDSLFAMTIYVLPKVYQAWKAPGEYRPGRFQSESRVSSNNRGSIEDDKVFSDEQEESYREEGDELKILVCTANLGNAEPISDSLEAWIPPGGACYRVNPLQGQPTLQGTFDLIAIGMQEATWTDSTRKRAVRIAGEKMTEEEILNALEAKSTAVLRELIQETLGDGYCQVADEQRGQMRLHLWAKRTILKDIMDVRISGANTGIGNVLANKGGIIAALYYRNTRISFMSAHLAAHEGVSYYKTRCDNVKSILREAKTFGLTKKFDDATSSHHMFVFGDLNFRTDFRTEGKHEDNFNRASALISAKEFERLYSFDELQEGLASGHLLTDFVTLPCHFPPTFKVERAPGFKYKEQRVPSYTDRILFKSAKGLSNNLKQVAYEPCVDFITSDHKPVRGAFSLMPNGAMDFFDLCGDLTLVFRKMRCSNLPAGDSDGKSDPYIMFLWDSIELETDHVTLMDKIRELWRGKSWPRTSYISKTLNPYWKGERMHLRASHTKIGYDAMLFLAVIDFDVVGKDEMLGCIALNMRELIKMHPGESTKTVEIDQFLTKEGKNSGRIKCKIDVTINLERRGIEVGRMLSMMSLRNVVRRSNPNLGRNRQVSSNSMSP